MHTYIVHEYNIFSSMCTCKEPMHMYAQRREKELPCKTMKKHVNPQSTLVSGILI